MIQLDLSILNQKGTPMFNSDIFANRPNFGIVGRIFISTDTSQIFRDTGTSYVLIASASAGLTGSGTPGTLPLWSGSTSLGDSLITQSASSLFASAKTFVNNTNTGISLLNPLGLSVGTTNTFNGGITWPTLEPCDNVEFLQLNQYGGNITYQIGSYTANHLILSSFIFLVASTTITSNQTTGIRALSNQTLQARINGTKNGTITHFANSQVYGDFAASTARFIFTNRYGYLVNDLDEYAAGHTYTNRFAFYNQGASDNNFFNGKVQIGGGTPGAFSFNLDVNGTARVSSSLTVDSTTLGLGGYVSKLIVRNTNDNESALYFPQFNVSSKGFDFSTQSDVLNIRRVLNNVATNHLRIFANLFECSVQSTFKDFVTVEDPNLKSRIYLRSIKGGFHVGYNQSGEIVVLSTQNDATIRYVSLGGTDSTDSTYTGVLNVRPNNGTVAIGVMNATTSSLLDLSSTTRGFLPPRMTTTQKNAIVTPAAGLIIYDSTLNKLCVRTAAAWETITSV